MCFLSSLLIILLCRETCASLRLCSLRLLEPSRSETPSLLQLGSLKPCRPFSQAWQVSPVSMESTSSPASLRTMTSPFRVQETQNGIACLTRDLGLDYKGLERVLQHATRSSFGHSGPGSSGGLTSTLGGLKRAVAEIPLQLPPISSHCLLASPPSVHICGKQCWPVHPCSRFFIVSMTTPSWALQGHHS